MIRVITAENIATNAHHLAGFAALRHRVFVERLGWSIPSPALRAGYEYDRFDDADAIYILVSNSNDDVVAGVRLIKTTRHFLLAELFPDLASEALPCGENVREATRFVVEPCRERLGDCADPSGQLIWALQSYGLMRGFTGFVSVSYAGMERLLGQAGCRFRRLGSPRRFDGRLAVPLHFEISDDILASVERRLSATATRLARPEAPETIVDPAVLAAFSAHRQPGAPTFAA